MEIIWIIFASVLFCMGLSGTIFGISALFMEKEADRGGIALLVAIALAGAFVMYSCFWLVSALTQTRVLVE